MNRVHAASTGHVSDAGPCGWHRAVKHLLCSKATGLGFEKLVVTLGTITF